jgi:hypothetical protein
MKADRIRMFHIGDILSITTGLLLAPGGMDGICDILCYMTGMRLCRHELPYASDRCKPYICEQYPQFDHQTNAELRMRIDGLEFTLAWLKEDTREHREECVDAWVSRIADYYGAMHPVNALPPNERDIL